MSRLQHDKDMMLEKDATFGDSKGQESQFFHEDTILTYSKWWRGADPITSQI